MVPLETPLHGAEHALASPAQEGLGFRVFSVIAGGRLVPAWTAESTFFTFKPDFRGATAETGACGRGL